MKQTGVGVAIAGVGSATGNLILDNHHLSQMVETSDEWISTRTGIKERRLVNSDGCADLAVGSLAEMAAQAAQAALNMAEISATDVDLIILATSTPDDLFGTACQIQTLIGANQAVAFDLTAACSGFVFGLVTAAQFIRTGVYQNVLLIGADILSRWVDWSDRGSCILFGDGAGAVVLQANSVDRLLGFELRSDGSQNNCLNLGYESQPQTLLKDITVGSGGYQQITMNGREIYRFAVAKVPEVIEKALYRANLLTENIDWLLLHQANQRIMNAVAQRLKLAPEKIISNLAKYGNTSAASIPLALDEAVRAGKIQSGDVIATSGFGAGLTWGAAILRWGK
ncbi:MAG: beta-ketoacyl-ACP synthase 3 [Oscillatoria sp. PMC 1068.18]|nr:beta-ketoacyl-ACP synthase 3 [Oscillatoria sp. PMC 1076.18]MEC4989475.1 beta-ketoacyl-ACP synthase 3 [Oscillatoria sp. PMC 1068.18]